ncbi:MAG: DNA helicase RecQ [Bacteroidia bacterium]|nr:DNA helicase RecQ [Bacteroidia bacterium]MCO5254358.1 DNA helicase RecQ [Bacteroidota bacterium]MCZ2129525.1 DNA helicase RecQ [Bacteroidia bacterium]
MSVLDKRLTPKEALKQFFGFDSFKGEQEKVIQCLLDGNDCFVIMPTGAGKSLCYQLPALMQDGTAIIISPLIALMKNQVDSIRGFSSTEKIAHFLNSSLSKTDISIVKEDISATNTKLLYVAPETLKKEETLEFLRTIKVSFVAVDEAHCISEWGHDFRPEYRRIKAMVHQLDSSVPIMALTATATPKVQYDIQKNLDMLDAEVFKSSFNRENLYYDIRPKRSKEKVYKNMVSYIKQHHGQSGIIYCLSRKKVEEIAEMLAINGIKALPYHAGLDAKTRVRNQDAFLMEDADVIVATIAFGMGIDKPDVRFVMHYDVPKSLEGYYQETGRSGRDGIVSDCIMYYNPNDIEKLEKFLKDKPVAEQEIGTLLIDETSAFSESSQCRRKFLLHYFGEEFDETNCNEMCDNCRHPKPKHEVQDEMEAFLKVMDGTLKGEYNVHHLVNFAVGKKSDSIKDYGHNKAKDFGYGKDKDNLFWKSISRLAYLNDFLIKNIEKYGLYSLSEKGREFIKKPYSLKMAIDVEYESVDEEDFESAKVEGSTDTVLFNMLKDLRKTVAKKYKLPPYVIFQDPSLEDMAMKYPITIEDLGSVHGVGKNKAEKYGEEFVKLIATYVEENDIDRPDDFVVKTSGEKSRKKIAIIQNIDKKVDIEDIAKSLGVGISEFIEELEQMVSAGTKLDLMYYLTELMDEEYLDEIFDFLKQQEEDNIEAALKAFDGDFSLEELRLCRLQFISDMSL